MMPAVMVAPALSTTLPRVASNDNFGVLIEDPEAMLIPVMALRKMLGAEIAPLMARLPCPARVKSPPVTAVEPSEAMVLPLEFPRFTPPAIPPLLCSVAAEIAPDPLSEIPPAVVERSTVEAVSTPVRVSALVFASAKLLLLSLIVPSEAMLLAPFSVTLPVMP